MERSKWTNYGRTLAYKYLRSSDFLILGRLKEITRTKKEIRLASVINFNYHLFLIISQNYNSF